MPTPPYLKFIFFAPLKCVSLLSPMYTVSSCACSTRVTSFSHPLKCLVTGSECGSVSTRTPSLSANVGSVISESAVNGDHQNGRNLFASTPSYTIIRISSHVSRYLMLLLVATHIIPGAEPVPIIASFPISANFFPYSSYMISTHLGHHSSSTSVAAKS